MRIHIGIENISNSHTPAIVFYLDSVSLSDVVLLTHPAIFVLVGYDLILDLTKEFVEIIDLVAHILNILRHFVGLQEKKVINLIL